MRLATREECREIEARSINERGLSSELLMEAAASLAAREIREFIVSKKLERKLKSKSFIAVACGVGGNGCDGLVIARHLESSGLNVRVYLLDENSKHALFSKNVSRLPKSIERRSSSDLDEFADAGLIIDAVLGVGGTRNVHGVTKSVIQAMNASAAAVVAVDTPTGLDVDTGCVLGEAVRAQLTLTFSLAKRGFFVNDGPSHVGRLRVLPIGLPSDLLREIASTQVGFTQASARRLLPKRDSASNKASHGHIAIFAGRPGMIGAGLLAGVGAVRTGVGYVTLVTHFAPTDSKARAEIASVAPEFLTLSSEDPDLWKKVDGSVAVVGPGFGVGVESISILKKLVDLGLPNVLVDADALASLAIERKEGRPLPLKKSWILTPHAGELARLIGGAAKELEAQRFESVERAARELGSIVLLKGFRTIVSDGKRSSVILSGNSALAKAGSGDILAGFIGGFLAQKVSPFEAACLGAYVHGCLADEWLQSGRDVLSLRPSDLAGALPLLLKKLRGRH